MAGYVPVLLTPMVMPLFEVVAARTSVRKLWPNVGLVNPEMINVMGCPPVNVPDKNDTVKSFIQDDTCCNDTIPVDDDGVIIATLPVDNCMPVPLSVMMILPSLGTVDSGVSVTVMITDVAPRATLLRVMVGELSPRSPMEGYVPE